MTRHVKFKIAAQNNKINFDSYYSNVFGQWLSALLSNINSYFDPGNSKILEFIMQFWEKLFNVIIERGYTRGSQLHQFFPPITARYYCHVAFIYQSRHKFDVTWLLLANLHAVLVSSYFKALVIRITYAIIVHITTTFDLKLVTDKLSVSLFFSFKLPPKVPKLDLKRIKVRFKIH